MENKKAGEQRKAQSYSLYENGYCHSKDLTLSEAEEMQKRHISCFPDCEWTIIPTYMDMQPKMKGHFSRH
jgi:hypothetical protein